MPKKDKRPKPNRTSLQVTLESLGDLPGEVVYKLSVEVSPDPPDGLAAEAVRRLVVAWQALTEDLDREMVDSFHRTLVERLMHAQQHGGGVRLKFPLDLNTDREE